MDPVPIWLCGSLICWLPFTLFAAFMEGRDGLPCSRSWHAPIGATSALLWFAVLPVFLFVSGVLLVNHAVWWVNKKGLEVYQWRKTFDTN